LIHDACIAWLEPRASSHGFEISPARVGVEGYQPRAVGKNKKGGRIRISTVDFTGVLMVTDGDRFLTTLVEGVGPAKAFGCGLLLVRPA
jgi:CRISPR system Cascade subunit CasE